MTTPDFWPDGAHLAAGVGPLLIFGGPADILSATILNALGLVLVRLFERYLHHRREIRRLEQNQENSYEKETKKTKKNNE